MTARKQPETVKLPKKPVLYYHIDDIIHSYLCILQPNYDMNLKEEKKKNLLLKMGEAM
jgi:hypothetical protein